MDPKKKQFNNARYKQPEFSYPTECATCGKAVGWDHVRYGARGNIDVYHNNPKCRPYDPTLNGRHNNSPYKNFGPDENDNDNPPEPPPSTGSGGVKPKKPLPGSGPSVARLTSIDPNAKSVLKPKSSGNYEIAPR